MTEHFKSHVINSATGAGINYQVQIIVYQGSGTDGGDACFLPCLDDFSDIRFYASDKTTRLDAWCESYTSQSVSTWWVEISADLSSSGTTIYVSCGNESDLYPQGNDQTQMDATFPLADHFYGASYSAWATARQTTWVAQLGANSSVSNSIVKAKTTSSFDLITSINSFAVGYAVRAYWRIPDKTMTTGGEIGFGFDWYVASPNTGADICTNQGLGTSYYGYGRRGSEGTARYTYMSRALADSSYHIAEIRRTATSCVWYQPDGTKTESTTTYYSQDSENIVVYASNSTTGYLEMDWLVVRKFVSTEPAHGAWEDIEDEEESPPSDYSNRVPIEITGSVDGIQTNYQMKLSIIKGNGENSGSTIYLNDNALDWPHDIRFTKADGTTLLDFWRVEYDTIDGSWWVEIDSIPASPSTVTIYLYYGKENTTDLIDFDATFPFGEPFTQGFLDTARWTTVDGSPTYSIYTVGHYMEVTNMTDGWDTGLGFHSKTISLPTSWKMQDAYGNSDGYYQSEGTTSIDELNKGWFSLHHDVYSADRGIAFTGVSDSWAATTNCVADTGVGGAIDYSTGAVEGPTMTKYWEITKTDGIIVITESGVVRVSEANSEVPDRFHLIISKLAGYTFGTIRFGAFLIRNYTTNEPSMSAGSEESGANIMIVYANIVYFQA